MVSGGFGVNPNLVHHGDGFRTHDARFRANGEYLEAISACVAKQSFCHLASGRVPGAEYEHTLFIGHEDSFSWQ
jgi:hypothetical protein